MTMRTNEQLGAMVRSLINSSPAKDDEYVILEVSHRIKVADKEGKVSSCKSKVVMFKNG